MEYTSLFIPIIFTIVFLLFLIKKHGNVITYNKTSVVVGSLIPTFVSLFIVCIMSLCMKSCGNTDTEYLSYYVTKIRHTDKWNEYIHRTCTRRVRTGTDKNGNAIYRTETYDCSYVDTHPERWVIYLNDGSKVYVHKNEFEEIKKLWNVPMVFVDMHRHYYTIDGDAQDYVWDKNRNTIKTRTIPHQYKNKIIKSQSSFKFRDITDEEAQELGLYNYPKIIDGEQNPIVGYSKFITDGDVKKLQYINSMYGKDKQFRTYLLIYPNGSASIVDDQRCYWQGGNKNEFITCVGIDSLSNEIQWVSCFSWLDDITMEVECRSHLLKDSVLSVASYSEWIENNLTLWKRKEFKDFEYIDEYLTAEQVNTIFITILIVNLIALIISLIAIYKN